jgi:GT2 family glycosyltransferase
MGTGRLRAWSTPRRPSLTSPSSIAASEPLALRLSVSVIICTYTDQRWELLVTAVTSVAAQTRPPNEIIVCVDHNESLLDRCHAELPRSTSVAARGIALRILANRYDGHLGSARNTAAEVAVGDVLAFLDDDAAAETDWLERLLQPYERDAVVAVGGAPLPMFERERPRWFPLELDWVFGCAYAGLPQTRAPLAHLVGANMSVRRAALREVGGFHSDNHDDMDMCHRVAHQRPDEMILYEPRAVVRHFVPAERVTWRYFWRRCYFVNRGKVVAFRAMGGAANLGAEARFVRNTLTRGLRRELSNVMRGDGYGAARAAAMLAGIALAAGGHLSGRIRLIVGRP